MKRAVAVLISISIFALTIVSALFISGKWESDTPEAKAGLLDLSTWDFSDEKTLKLINCTLCKGQLKKAYAIC